MGRKLKQMLDRFFDPLIQEPLFVAKTNEWLLHLGDRFRWDTSLLKIADNLIIGFSATARAAEITEKSNAMGA